MTDQDDKVFKQWANTYAEQYGRTLLEENRLLAEQKIKYATPQADARIKELIKSGKKRSRSRMPYFIAAAAALLVLAIGTPAVLMSQNLDIWSVFEPAIDSGSTADTILDPVTAPQELDFNLPAQFSIADVEWDNGETIYYLNNSQLDDVVLTLRESEENSSWMQSMDKVYIDNSPVPAKIRDEFKLLTFESQGTLYTISCRDDLETLTSLYSSITNPENQKV